MADKPIAELAAAPVVSSDATSPESMMAREAKRLQVQASTDSQFDTVIERFCGGPTITLVSMTTILTLFLLAELLKRKR